jgi:hypothetical protein
MPESDATRLAREVIAIGDRDVAVARLLGSSNDPAFLADVAAYTAQVAREVAHVAARMAAEAIARGVDAPLVETDPAASYGVLDLVYRKMASE